MTIFSVILKSNLEFGLKVFESIGELKVKNYENINNSNPEYRSAKINLIAIIPRIIIFIFLLLAYMYINSTYAMNTDVMAIRFLLFLLLFFVVISFFKIIQIKLLK